MDEKTKREIFDALGETGPGADWPGGWREAFSPAELEALGAVVVAAKRLPRETGGDKIAKTYGSTLLFALGGHPRDQVRGVVMGVLATVRDNTRGRTSWHAELLAATVNAETLLGHQVRH